MQKAKLFSANQNKQAQVECAVHSSFQHRNIVSAFDYTEDDEYYTLIMENCNDASYFEDKIENVGLDTAVRL